jgi:hygromycin-B 7''-O-kinase
MQISVSPPPETDLFCLDSLEGYRKKFMSVRLWKPYVRAVCQRLVLTPCRRIRAGLAGTYPTFIVDERWVVKFFGRLFEGSESFVAEHEALRLVIPAHLVAMPSILASGTLFEKSSHWPWPYMVMTYIPGGSLSQVYLSVSLEDKLLLATWLGTIVRRLHELEFGDSDFFRSSWGHYLSFLTHQRIALTSDEHKLNSLPSYLRESASGYVLPPADLVDMDTNPHLIHADLTADHILGWLKDGGWQTTGIIDFGDAMVGNLLYELQALHLDLFRCDKRLLRAFLDAYGMPASLQRTLPRKAMSMTLLHRFNLLAGPALDIKGMCHARSLEEIADLLWNVESQPFS